MYLSDVGIPETVVVALVKKSGAQAESALAAVKEGTAVASQLPSGGGGGGVPLVPAVPTAVLLTNTVAEAVVEAPAQAPAVVVQPAPAPEPVVNNYYYFQEALSPYGTWVEVAPYGWCWQPTVAVIDAGWRPYAHGGRWVWTDCGWYWRSDYSWGWAPFHYGRWHWMAPGGWYWVPGSVWGPAWVSWRYTDAYCGWAPLPPEAYYTVGFGFTYRGARVGVGFDYGLAHHHYTFVDYHRFRESHPHRHAVGPDRRSTVYGNSTVINNYIVGDNNTIINRGVGVERVSAVTRTEVRKVALQEVQPGSGRSVRPDTMSADGRALSVYRPDVRPRGPGSAGGSEAGSARQEASKPVAGGVARPVVSAGERPGLNVPLQPRAAGRVTAGGASQPAPLAVGGRGKPTEPNRASGQAAPGARGTLGPGGAGLAEPLSPAGAAAAPVRREEVRSAPTRGTPAPSRTPAVATTPRPAPVPSVAPRAGAVVPAGGVSGGGGSGNGSVAGPGARLPVRPTPTVTTTPGALREPRRPQPLPTPAVATPPQAVRQEAPKAVVPSGAPAVRSLPAPASAPGGSPAGIETRSGGINRSPASALPPARVAPTPAPSRAVPTPAPSRAVPAPAPSAPAPNRGNGPGRPPEVN